MKDLIKKLIVLGIVTFISNAAFSAAPTVDNYRGVVRAVLAKFDRDYSRLNPQGQPDPGALMIVEKFLSVFNALKITGPGEYHFFMTEASPMQGCFQAAQDCQELKVLVRNSTHSGDSTLFGAANAFTFDIIVWSNSGNGFERFLLGHYTPVLGTAGKANMTVISCSGCSTVGHSQIEWDGTGVFYHLRSTMYDTHVENSNADSGIQADAVYSPLTGQMKIAISGKNVCDAAAIGDSICSQGPNSRTTGYAAILHANTITGNVYLQGVQGANNSTTVPTQDPMCLKADGTEDVSGAVCQADAIDNFNGITPYSANDAPDSFIAAGSPWPMAEITDSPTF